MLGFLSNFSCCFPQAIFRNFFYYFEKEKKRNIFHFLMTWFFVFVNMGPYGNKNVKTLLLQIAAKLLPNFLLNGPHKNAFGVFEN